ALEGLDLYAVLGVERKADKRAIRNAYFELSKLFHPDAHFGKQLGGFKPKMEGVFKRLTEAYETLGKPKKRAEYDEYLLTTERTRAVRQTLDSLEFSAAEIQALQQAGDRARERAAEQAAQMPSKEELRPPRAPVMEPAAAPRSSRPPQTTLRPAPTSAERRARVRDRLLQRMGSISQRPPPPAPPPANDQPSSQNQRSVVEGLRQSIRVSAGMTGATTSQAQGFLKKAQDAERSGDPLFAASQLQAGLVVDPNNPELLAEYERVSKVVARNLADNYEKQAQYEEKTSNWEAAARSWARVSDGRPEDAAAARSAAEAMLKTRSDLHRAQKYAQKAVALDGKNVTNLTVLARVYLAAGLKLNALRELEKAAHLAPRDEMVNNLLREAR
ncbi:MAG: DnaJ domain-containing protein, partial [Polyangiales bacterium]